MTNYTPTTEYVRDIFRYQDGIAMPELTEDFDRWLDGVKLEAFDRGYSEGYREGLEEAAS